MGGRGSGSRMTSSSASGGSDSARSRYDAAKARADEIAAREMSKPNGQRWKGDSNQQYIEARRQEADAGSEYLLSRVTDSVIEREMDRYIDEAIREEGTRTTEKWVKVLAGTKKDGSPTARARENARIDRSDDIATRIGNSLGLSHTHTYMSEQQHNKERDRLADSIMRVARNRMKDGSLR